MAEHNHLTRDIKPLWSGCHGCDEYHVNALQMRIAELLAERDAARADAQRFSDEIDRMVGELSTIRAEHEAEVAALREQYVVEEFIDTDGYPSMRVVKGEHVGENQWAANIRREVLADLRAKVRMIPAHAVRMENKWMNGRGWVPTTETICTVPLAAVLALIEEAE